MTKIKPRDAWAIYTPPTAANHLNPTCGQFVIDTEARVPVYLNADPGRRLVQARKIVEDDVEDAQLEAHRALLRFVVLDGFGFSAVWHAFAAVEGFEVVPDGRHRDAQRIEMH